MKLLQVPTANLEERIKEELEENPALEVAEEDHDDGLTDDSKDEFETADEEFEPDNFPQVNHNTSMCVMQFGFSPYRKPFDAPEAHR